MKKVRILLATYNGEMYLCEQLDSLVSQTYQNIEIFIRDDGSSDKTIDILKKYEKKYSQMIHIVKDEENLGYPDCFWRLLEISGEADYYAFCDQDDYWYPNKIQNAVDWMKQEKNQIPLLYHGGFEIGNEDLSIRNKYPTNRFCYTFRTSLTSNIFFGFSVVINRKLYEQLKRADFEKVKYHDWFAGMIVAAFGKYYMSDEVEAVHRQHNNNTSPLYFFKKIPDGLKLLKGDDLYTRNAREFYRLFQGGLDEEQKEICELFLNEKYRVTAAVKKAFYPKRWNPQIKVEFVIRMLMLIGKI